MTNGETSAPLTPRQAIARWQRKEIDGPALTRCLVSYDKWQVPVAEASVAETLQGRAQPRVLFSRDQEGVTRLFIFSDGAACDAYRGATGTTSEQYFIETTGTWVFRLPLEQFDSIVIDRRSPHEITCWPKQYDTLRLVAGAVEVEEALAALRAGTGDGERLLALVANYPEYSMPVSKSETGYRAALAPDPTGRALAAVFTAEDAFDAYLEASKGQAGAGERLQMRLTGPELFARLQQMRLNGVVFNCYGPPKPVAFAARFAEIALQHARG
ncbi:MAG TPA: hypothetical protein VF546_21350 [Pyrinomonadaceae bacterium]|jgi:hypothetical protein